MTPRSIRRAAERKALKQARKAAHFLAAADEQLPPTGVTPGCENAAPARIEEHIAPRRLTEARLSANRANAQLSTGPKTRVGRAISCLNNSKFGLTGTHFTALSWEDGVEFDQFLAELLDEHQPSTPTERILVEKMAQHHWLSQRAMLLQNLSIEKSGCESPEEQKQLALYIRYETTHERAFSKCLDQLLKIRAAREKEARGFESQKQQAAEEARRQEAHRARVRIANARAEHLESLNDGRHTTESGPSPANPMISEVLSEPAETRDRLCSLPDQASGL